MEYLEALASLYKLIQQGRTSLAPMTLERSLTLMQYLGNPHNAYPILHVTGTKGKGSVGALCAAVLREAGYRVGLYSSPHLQDFRERIKINGNLIPEVAVVELVERLQPSLSEIPGLTWFEAVTGMAFAYFESQAPDLAIIEVGIGGRVDATNVVNPILSVITSLSLDHTNLLGDTLPQIAREKGGIIKPSVPAVIAPQSAEVLAVLESIAAQQKAPLTIVGRDWLFESLGGDLSWERWKAAPQGEAFQEYRTTLLGKHQAINGTVALAALEKLGEAGFTISDDAIHIGFETVNWPGRLEIVRDAPLVVLDAAHNGDSAHWLAETLKERFPKRPRVLVFAAKQDKDSAGMLEALLPTADCMIATQVEDFRPTPAESIAALAHEVAPDLPIETLSTPSEAITRAEQIAGEDGMVCVTGSLYLVGEARNVYQLEPGRAVHLGLKS